MLKAESCPQCSAPIPLSSSSRFNCSYCGATLVRLREKENQTDTEQTSYGIGFKNIICKDSQLGGMECFRLVIPSEWEFSGGVFWGTDNPGLPAVITFRIYNPHGIEAFEVFPNQPFYWTNDPMTQMLFPIGSRYFGNEIHPPLRAIEMLQKIVLPRFRADVKNLRILNQEILPNLAKEVRLSTLGDSSAGAQNNEGARLRVQYQWQNTDIEEDLLGVVEWTQIRMPSLFGVNEMTFWMADYLCAFRAKQGMLDSLANIFQVAVQSIRINPVWYSNFLQISQGLINQQTQHIRQIGQLSRSISQTNQEISDNIMRSWQERQEVYDRLGNQISQTIRGVDEYTDPFRGESVELPGGYQYAWANALGEYILTNDSFFNPNQHSNQNWENLQHK